MRANRAVVDFPNLSLRRIAGAVILIERFGSALHLNIHFHMLFLDGVSR